MCIRFPDQELSPDPLYWKHDVLATGPPGKSFQEPSWQQAGDECLLVSLCDMTLHDSGKILLGFLSGPGG